MIHRIRKVKEFRSFREWTAPPELPNFEQVNLIYGANGTGKSTIAALLHNAATDDAWKSGLELETQDVAGSRVVNSAGDPIWPDVKVFGRDYVEANLRFEEVGGGSAEPLLVLGEKNVETEKQRLQLEQRLSEIDAGVPKLRKLSEKCATTETELLRRQARQIAADLGDLGGRYAERSYNAGTLRKALDDSRDEDHSAANDVDLAKELAVVREQPLPEQPVPSSGELSLDALAADIGVALQSTAKSRAIQDLLQHPDWQDWVGHGIGLHAELDRCIYCQQPLTDERRAELDAHFDDSLRRLQADLDGLAGRLAAMEKDCSDGFAALPKPAELFQSLRAEYTPEVTALGKAKRAFDTSVDFLQKAIDSKRGALFTAQDLTWTKPGPVVSFHGVSGVLGKHNVLASSLDTNRQEAGGRVEGAMVEAVRHAYDTGRAQSETAKSEMTALAQEQSEVRAQLKLASTDDFDPQPLADQLNADVSQLLGHETLRFIVDGPGYRITRNGAPAEHLSEGERNAISLLYFLQSLKAHGTNAAKAIVVIDDPVSSLDGNALVGASAHLWSELVGSAKCRQLFVLTHNFELFRTWILQLNQLRPHDGVSTHVFEMRTVVRKVRSGDLARCPALISWPDDPRLRNRLRSEYHYLFWRVAATLIECKTDPSPEHDLEAATVLPNACRRLLEGFLGFKAPALVGNFHDQVMETGGTAVTKPVRTRVLRFLHAYSHNEEADISKPVARPEAVNMLDVVFEFMREIDGEHVEAMCKAVDVDPAMLGGEGLE